MQYIKDLLIVKFCDSVVMAVFVAALVLCVSPGVGADNGLTHDFKIGVVNTKEVFDNYERQKKDYEKLREALEEAQKPIAELSEQITRDKERYDAETNSLVFNSHRSVAHVRTLWEMLGDKGLKVGVVSVPMTYPPRPVNGFRISGFETPGVHVD